MGQRATRGTQPMSRITTCSGQQLLLQLSHLIVNRRCLHTLQVLHKSHEYFEQHHDGRTTGNPFSPGGLCRQYPLPPTRWK